MRKIVYLLCLIFLIFGISACSSNDEKETVISEDLEDLDLHVLAIHEQADMSEYYTELYENIKHTINENPKMGQPTEFTLRPYRTFKNHDGLFYVFLGINRYATAIQNVSFNLTVGDEADRMIWDEDTIFLPAEETGEIPPHSALPVLIPITKDTYEEAENVDFKQLDMNVAGLSYDTMTD